MSTLSLFQKQPPQVTSSVRYQPQQSAPLTQVGLSLVTSPQCCFVCVCVFSIVLVMTALGEWTHQHRCTGIEWAGCFLSVVKEKTN